MKFTNVTVLLFSMILILGCSPKSYNLSYKVPKRFKNKYLNQLGKGSHMIHAAYHFTVEKSRDGNFVRKQFYPDTKQITHYYTYSNIDLIERNGYVKEWWDNGDMRFEGEYQNDKRIGEWKEYFNSSEKSTTSKGQYKQGEKDGIWKSHDEKNILLSESTYKNGKRHGVYKIFTDEGKLLEKGFYENDKRGKYENFDGKSRPGGEVKIVEEMPRYPGCEEILDKEKKKECSDNKMLIFIYSNIKYPAKAREYGVEGRVLAKFMVDENGKIANVNVMRGVCKEMKAEIERIIKMMPVWHAGTQKGKRVKVWFTLPV